jgi:hypothetical protein
MARTGAFAFGAASNLTAGTIARNDLFVSGFDPSVVRPDIFPDSVIFPFPFPTPGRPQPTSPTASASDLQVLIAMVPVAHDGHVITAEYHNALRNALIAIANRLGLGPVSEEITITSAPRFLRHGNLPEWEQQYGFVQRLAATPPSGGIHGWMELDLPDGARIKRMVVYATRHGIGSLKVKLKRQRITDRNVAPDLIAVEIAADADEARGTEGDVTVPGIGAGADTIAEFRIVNNREHKYLLTAELEDINVDSTARIGAIQIVCGR